MPAEIIALLVVHIAVAAGAFGVALGVGASMKRGRSAGAEAFRLATAEGARRGKMASIMGILTFLTGVGLIFMVRGGFKGLPMGINAAMGLIIVMILLGALLLGPTAAKLVVAAEKGTDDPAIGGLLKKMSMGEGIMHTLWLTVLVMMFVK